MPRVKVKLLVNREELEIEIKGSKLRDLIEDLRSRYRDPKIREYFDFMPRILVNGLNYETLKHLETELKDGDIVTFLPAEFPLSGG
jgi:molybdopterin converting factor small subunit